MLPFEAVEVFHVISLDVYGGVSLLYHVRSDRLHIFVQPFDECWMILDAEQCLISDSVS